MTLPGTLGMSVPGNSMFFFYFIQQLPFCASQGM